VQNVDKRSALVTVRGPLANNQKKNLRSDDESGCGWLYLNPKSLENSKPALAWPKASEESAFFLLSFFCDD